MIRGSIFPDRYPTNGLCSSKTLATTAGSQFTHNRQRTHRLPSDGPHLDSPRMLACARRGPALEIVDCVIELPVAAMQTALSPIEINRVIRFNGCSFEN